MDLQRVYQNVRSFRELKRLTREEVAARVGITTSGYGKIERGEVDITLSRLVKIADALEVDLSRLLNFETSQVFSFNLQPHALVQAPGAHAQTLNLYGNTFNEEFLKQLKKELNRIPD